MSTNTADTYGISPPPVEINAIVPGSIFQDDITPPTFGDGNVNEPVSASIGEPTIPSGANVVGVKGPDIEVSSTIQTVLISLGIVVGALCLLGVVATLFITHKNKRAEEKKKRVSEIPEGEDEKGGGGVGRLKTDDEKSELVTVMIDDYDKKQKKQKGSPSSSSSSTSPKGSIIGGVGTAVGTGAAAGTRAGNHGDNTRNSFMEVAQVYARRQSITPTPLPPQSAMTGSDSSTSLGTSSSIRSAGPGYSQQHGSSELQIGIFPHSSSAPHHQQPHPFQQHLQQQFSPFLPDQSSPHFPISPSSAGTMDESKNPFASPPLSAGLQDPFRTQNNSQVDLTLGVTASASSSGSGLGSRGPTPSTSSTSLSSSSQMSAIDRKLVANSTPSPPTTIANKFSSGTSSSPQGPGSAATTNEGNAWYRKRNSIIIPDGAAAHVRLWRDDGEEIANSSPRLQRPLRSGSHSSTTGPLGISTSPSSSPMAIGGVNATTAPSPLHNASRWSPSRSSDQSQGGFEEESRERGGGGLEAKASTVSRNGAAVFEGRAKISTSFSPSRSKSLAGFDNDMCLTPRTPTTAKVPLLVEPVARGLDEEGEGPSEEVIVRLRANRRGSHSSHRQSYLDDLPQQ